MTKNQREFQKQIKRLERSMNRLLKQDNYVPQFDLPEQSKRVTRQMLTKLESLKGRDFLAKIDTETGEAFIGKQPEIRSRRRAKHETTYIPHYTAYDEIYKRFKEAEQEILSLYTSQAYGRDLITKKLEFIRHLISTLEYNHEQYGGLYTARLLHYQGSAETRVFEKADLEYKQNSWYYKLNDQEKLYGGHYEAQLKSKNPYEGYLTGQQETIAELLTPLIYDSKLEVVESSYTELFLILNPSEETIDKEAMSDISEILDKLDEEYGIES